MHALSSWRGVSPARRRLLPRTALLLLAVRVGLLVLPFRSVCVVLAWARRRLMATPRLGYTEADVMWCVSRANRVLPSATCLTRALVIQHLLAPCGALPALRIGVRRARPGMIEAHAWVQVEDRVIGSSGEVGDYAVLRATAPGAATIGELRSGAEM